MSRWSLGTRVKKSREIANDKKKKSVSWSLQYKGHLFQLNLELEQQYYPKKVRGYQLIVRSYINNKNHTEFVMIEECKKHSSEKLMNATIKAHYQSYVLFDKIIEQSQQVG